MKYIFSIVLIVFLSSFKIAAQRTSLYGGDTVAAEEDSVYKNLKPEIVYYTSNNLQLKAYLYKPSAKGHFPVYIWNHGSEQNPGYNKRLASFWLKQGYIFFEPIRSGQSDNPGTYICKREKLIRSTKEPEQVQFRQIYALHKKANEDVVAALQWIKHMPYADSNKIVIAGGGYGGIQVLLTAEKDGQSALGIKCFVVMSPASTIWNKMWRDSLTQAITIAKRPLFLLQAGNDYTLRSAETLGSVIEEKGFPNRYKIFPDHVMPGANISDHKQGHGEFFADPKAWEKEVLMFLHDCGMRSKNKKDIR